MASRNQTKALEAIQNIKSELDHHPSSDPKPTSIEFLPFDLSILSSGKSAAETFLSKENRLDILINNAGIMATPYQLSQDGIELQACNAIGHFALTIPLLPILKQTDSSSPDSQVRIVNLSSIAHQAASSQPDFSSLEAINRSYSSTWTRYGNSKLANILFNNELQRRLEGTNIHCIAVHPGVVDTDLFRGVAQSWPILKPAISLQSWFRGIFFISPQQGAFTSLYAATSAEVNEKKLKGAYLVPYGKVQTPTKLAQDPDHRLAQEFWSTCESLVASAS